VAIAALTSWRERYPWLGYLSPFVVLIALISLPKGQALIYWEWPIQVAVVGAVAYATWPDELPIRPTRWLTSIAIGVLVFGLWIAPEVVYPPYRHLPIFSNALFGHVGSSLQAEALKSKSVLFWRTIRASTVVPIAEELFWRAWLMRWIANNDFEKVPLGAYRPVAFWLTALFFGAEHGPYWEVGLITGVIYNFWMVRSKSVADCILMHAVTNLLLSIYVIAYGQWQYWQ
jgi:hypothetical protein